MLGDPRREFGINLDTAPRRHLSFENEQEFRDFVATRKRLERLDVGAVFRIEPSYQCFAPADAQQVVRRDLRFDIDIGDYDRLRSLGDPAAKDQAAGRSCCVDRGYCPSCWPLVTIGCAALEIALRTELRVEKVDFFFSGGRGMHC
jgi:DNA primase small subunit